MHLSFCTNFYTAVTKNFFYFVTLYKFLYFVLSEERNRYVFLIEICVCRKLEVNCFLPDNHGLLELLCFLSLRQMRAESNCLSSHERFINISGWDALATSKTQWCIMPYSTRHKHQRLRKSHPKYYESASWL